MPKLETGQTVLGALSGFAKGLKEGLILRKELDLKQQQQEQALIARKESQEFAREKFEFEKQESGERLQIQRDRLEESQDEDDFKQQRFEAELEGRIATIRGKKSDFSKKVFDIEESLGEARNLSIQLGNVKPDNEQKVSNAYDQLDEFIANGEFEKSKKLRKQMEDLGVNADNLKDYADRRSSLNELKSQTADFDRSIERLKNLRSDTAKKVEKVATETVQTVPIDPTLAAGWSDAINQAAPKGDLNTLRQVAANIRSNQSIPQSVKDQWYMAIAESVSSGDIAKLGKQLEEPRSTAQELMGQ